MSSFAILVTLLMLNNVFSASTTIPCDCISCVTNLRLTNYNEIRQRKEITNEQEREWMLLNSTEIHPKRALFLMLMAQQMYPPNVRLPFDVFPKIEQYADYNEIRTLFQICTSAEDRIGVLGVETYQQLHQQYPSRMAKVKYLETLRRLTVRRLSLSMMPASDWRDKYLEILQRVSSGVTGTIEFDENQNFIKSINVQSFKYYLCADGQSSIFVGPIKDRDPKTIDWRYVGGMKHLISFNLKDLEIGISTQDTSLLPTGLKVLNAKIVEQ